MACMNEIFPIILYALGSILLIALIILTVKVIKTVKKVNEVVDDLNNKSRKLNGVFDIVDNATDALSIMSDKVVNFLVNGIVNLFTRKKKEEKDDE